MRNTCLVSLLLLVGCVGDSPVVSGTDSGTDSGTSSNTDSSTPNDASPTSDASAEAGADASVSISPTTLDSQDMLALWLEAAPQNYTTINGIVHTWLDRSKNHNDAASAGTTYPAIVNGAINGHGALSFPDNATWLTIPDAASLQFGTDDYLVVAVANPATGGAYFFSKALYNNCGSSGCHYNVGLELFAMSSTLADGGTSLFPATNLDQTDKEYWGDPAFDGSFHVVASRRQGSNLFVYFDAQTPRSQGVNTVDVSLAQTAVTLGFVSQGTFHPPVSMEMSELIAVHKGPTLDDATVNGVLSYLRAKYNL